MVSSCGRFRRQAKATRCATARKYYRTTQPKVRSATVPCGQSPQLNPGTRFMHCCAGPQSCNCRSHSFISVQPSSIVDGECPPTLGLPISYPGGHETCLHSNEPRVFTQLQAAAIASHTVLTALLVTAVGLKRSSVRKAGLTQTVKDCKVLCTGTQVRCTAAHNQPALRTGRRRMAQKEKA